jgi:hypothetical protein
MLSSGSGNEESLSQLLSRSKEFARVVVDALANLELETRRMEARMCLISELECDMVLQEDVRTATDMLLVAKGTQISYALLARLRNFLRRDPISGTVLVHLTRHQPTQRFFPKPIRQRPELHSPSPESIDQELPATRPQVRLPTAQTMSRNR